MKEQGKRYSENHDKKEEVYDASAKTIKVPDVDDLPDEADIEFKKKLALKERRRDEQKKKKNDEKLSKMIRKRQKRSEHSKRETLSYEDLPLEEREPEKKRKLKKKPVIAAICILAALVMVVLYFANADIFTFDSIKNYVEYGIFNNRPEESFPISVRGESVTSGNFRLMNRYLAYASDTTFSTVNSYGKTISTSSVSYTSPVLVTKGDLAMLYHLGGKEFEIRTLDKIVFTGTAENNIFVGDVSSSGVYTLVTESDGYLSKMYVYNSDNEQIYAYSFADYYVTSVSLNSSGTKALVSGISALNGSEISSLYILDFNSEEPVMFKEFRDNIIYEVRYLSDSNACAIGANSAFGIKTRAGDVFETSYEGKTLSAYTINSDTKTFTISLSRSGDGRNCEILNFNIYGSVTSSFDTQLKVVSVSSYKNRVALLSEGTVYLYNKDGKLVSSTEAGLDPHAILLYSRKDAYILGTGEINRIGL